MSKPTIRIHDISTNIIIDREMTDEEFAQYEADQAAEAARITAEAEAKAAEEAAKLAAQAKLTALGLTVEDLQALGL
jgi:hypothetical protein